MSTEQIQALNAYVKTKIAPSPIHGVGVFALRDIPKGEKLYADMAPQMYTLPFKEFKQLMPNVRKTLLERWPEVVNGSAFFYPETRIVAFMNHSDEPNYDAQNDVVLRDIAQGEEITEDYRRIPSAKVVFPWVYK